MTTRTRLMSVSTGQSLSWKGKGRKGNKRLPRGVCWNCGEKGAF